MALHITQEVLNAANERLINNDIDGAWQILAEGGDRYAASAYSIIAEWQDPQSVFAQIVQAQWYRLVGPDVIQEKFLVVGKQHLSQYLNDVRDAPTSSGYLLPNTEQIEASYRQAMLDNGLPALAAVDSMFSILDYRIERVNEFPYPLMKTTGVEDLTWARLLDNELEAGRIVYDSEVFLNDNIDNPLGETLKTAFTVRLLYGEMAWARIWGIIIDAAGDALPQIMREEDPQAITTSAALLLSIDAGLTDEKLTRILDASYLDKLASDQRRGLAGLVVSLEKALFGRDINTPLTKEVLFDKANVLMEQIRSEPALQFNLNELIDIPADTLYLLAKQDNNEGLAYRHALVNLDAFIIQRNSDGTIPPFISQDNYSLVQYSEQYLKDRAQFLAHKNTFYFTDQSVIGTDRLEFIDKTSGLVLSTDFAGNSRSRRFYFGSNDIDTLKGGERDDHIYGGANNDRLIGNDGNDYIEGNSGNDTLEGGTGNDTYWFAPGDGKDTISDSDHSGQIIIGNYTLTGAGDATPQIVEGKITWTDAQGYQYQLQRIGSQYDLVITGGELKPDDQITIKNYRFSDQSLDIKLNFPPELAVLTSAASNPFFDTGIAPPTGSSELFETGSQSLKVALNQPAKAGDKILINATGFDATLLSLTSNGQTHNMGTGPVQLTLKEGQTEVVFTVANTSDIDTVANYTLSATWQPSDTNIQPASGDYHLTVNGLDESQGGITTTNTILGTAGADDLGGTHSADEAHLDDTEGNDLIDAGAGNDTVSKTRGGDDIIYLGDGDDDLFTFNSAGGRIIAYGGEGRDYLGAGAEGDHLEGGPGADALYGSSGNDLLYGDDFGLSADFIAQGAMETGTGLIGEWVDAEGGHDQVFTGAGNDLIAGGDGHDLIVTGGGDDWIWGDWNTYSPAEEDWRLWGMDEVVETDAAGNTTYHFNVSHIFSESHAGSGDDTVYAGAGNDMAQGERGNDTLYLEAGDDKGWGGEGHDTLFGGSGNDLLIGDNADSRIAPALHGNDFLDGGDGDDTLFGSGGTDSLFGGAGDDKLYGDNGDDNAGDDYLDGEDGNDLLLGGAGADILYGGNDHDELYGDSSDTAGALQGNDYLDGEAGNDILVGYGGDDTLLGGSGDDELYGESGDTPIEFHGDDFMDGGDGNDVLVASGGSDTLLGGIGDDQLYGDASDIDAADHGDDYLDGGDGADTLVGSGGRDTLFGGAGNDVMDGDSSDTDAALQADDWLDGGAGDDTLFGGGGADILYGGADNDILLGDYSGLDAAYHGDDILSGDAGADQLYGQGGNDSLSGGEDDDLLSGGTGNDSLSGDGGADTLYGGDGDDTLYGGAGDDRLYGNNGNDRLFGGSGNDLLHGGSGINILEGGSGQDTYVYNLGNGTSYIRDSGSNTLRFGSGIFFNNITLALGSLQIKINGTDDSIHIENFDPDNPYANVAIDRFEFADGTVVNYEQLLELGIQFDGTDGDDTLIGTNAKDSLRGYGGNDTIIAKDGDDLLEGGSGNDVLYGNGGNDALDGGSGNDSMQGGAGDDIYQVDTAGDTVIEAIDEGYDTVQSQVSYTLSDQVEALELQGAALEGQGNSGDNHITGNAQDNQLFGHEGNDTLIGQGGNDTLDGGTGTDTLVGGAGDDTYHVDDSGDTIQESASAGHDRVMASASYNLSGNVEDLTLTGNAALNGSGNALDNHIQGNDADNQLYGGSGDDTLLGQAGNDTLDGQSGADTMLGGLGDDSYIVDNSNDQVLEQVDAGLDTVYTAMTYQLGDNLENLVLTGSQAVDGSGNALDNHISGNNQGNVLDGQGGTDTLVGLAGNDHYHVDQGTDMVIETANNGYDTVHSLAADYTLGAHVEQLLLEGTGAINGTGNNLHNHMVGNVNNNIMAGAEGSDTLSGGAGDDHLYGDLGSDSLNGDAGADWLFGGAGYDWLDGGSGVDQMAGGSNNDTYIVDETADVVVEQLNEGHDTVYSSATYTLSAHVEDLLLQGAQAIDGTGNALHNRLYGNNADNSLSGGDGNDYLWGSYGVNQLFGDAGNDTLDGANGDSALYGGTGNDRYIIDSASDSISEVLDGGYDSVASAVSHTLSEHVEALELTGSGALSGTGNDLDNDLLGNDQDNTLTGLGGNDSIDGAAGNDALYGNSGDDYLYGGDDALVYIDGDYYGGGGYYGGGEYYGGGYYVVAPNDDYLDGGAGNDYLDGASGDDTLYGGTGDDYLYGGDDGTYGGNYGGGEYYGGGGYYGGGETAANLSNNDYLNGGDGQDILDGGTGQDSLYGGSGIDTLYGGSGHDWLDGGTGLDEMSGGSGSDVYYVDGYSETILVPVEDDDDHQDDEPSCDCQDVDEPSWHSGKGNEGVGNGEDPPPPGHDDNYNDGPGTSPGDPGSQHPGGASGDDSGAKDNGGQDKYAGKDDDHHDGKQDHEHGDGQDAGDDCQDPGDTDTGNEGVGYIEKTIYYTDTVIEQAYSGYDVVYASITYTLTDHVEELHLTGTGSWDAQGNALDNWIYGNSGDNVLDGGLGHDWLRGGLGDDTYRVDSLYDQVIEYANEGWDTVQASVDYQLTAHLENLVLIGDQSVAATGNEHNNRLTGNGADNQLLGHGGNDILQGGRGNDQLDGGAGDDTYRYNRGDGLDSINDASGMDSVVFGDSIGFDQLAVRTVSENGVTTAQLRILDCHGNEQRDQGMDIMLDPLDQSSPIETFVMADGATYTLDDLLIRRVEHPGSNKSDKLLLGRDDDVVNAGKGNDWIAAGTGNDRLLGEAGRDTLYGQGGIDQLFGGDHQDKLHGGGGNDLLFGGDGNDVLKDGQGNDLIIGGQGNDDVHLHCGWNTVLYNQGDGRDELELDEPVQGVTLSLGGGIALADISLQKDGDDLLMHFDSPPGEDDEDEPVNDGHGGEEHGSGSDDEHSGASLVLSDWYDDDNALGSPSLILQIINESNDHLVQQFDLNALVQAFDAQRPETEVSSLWQLTHVAMDNLLSSSDDEAIGGELAYGYAGSGTLDPNVATPLGTLQDERFGLANQTFQVKT